MTSSNIHRATIIDLFKRGISRNEICKRIGISRHVVYRTIKRFTEIGTLSDRIGRGRKPTVTTPEKVKAIRERIRRDPHRSIRKLATDMGMSRVLIQKIVRKKLNLKCYRVTKAAILSERNKQKRLEKAKFLLSGTRRGDHLVTVFSDEKLFTVEAECNSQNHRVLAKDIKEASEKGKTIHRVSHPASVMIKTSESPRKCTSRKF
ncbi:hypothetical protein B9Z55_025705 [Caenorhabditis nigoni]|uniref:Paired domain-containing protein n=1 Tax=Caenorhabditis nigoni TaxID=1611254 RepID=A0A2G5T065_9PELO|nr:hypothetical protein B9Z55_025705 [Caenorhabditis nigoni]